MIEIYDRIPGDGEAGGPPSGGASEDEARLEDVRRRAEAFQQELQLEYYESNAGLKGETNVSKIYRKYEDLLARPTIDLARRQLERVKAAPQGDAGAEKATRLRNLAEFLVDEFIGGEVKTIIDEILTRESAARVKVGQDEIAFRQLAAEIANTDDRDRRALLEAKVLSVIEELTPLLAERIGIERGIARSFGFDTYTRLWEATAGIDLVELDQAMQRFLQRTEDMYRDAMGWVVRKRLGIELADARRHDLSWLLRANELDDRFKKEEMIPTAGRFAEEMGLDPTAHGNIRFDVEPRERKRPRAFTAMIRIPQEIVLVLHPEGGRRDWQGFLHELGHALHYGHVSPTEPYETRCLGDASLTETYAFLFQYLLLDKGWLKRFAGIAKPKELLFLSYLEKLYYLRRYAAKLHYELALHDGNGVEGKDKLYEDTLVSAVKIRYPRELFLYDVDRAYYVARYLRAWLFEALLSKHLVHYFDEDWYRNPRTGAFLKKLWATGQRYRVEEMVKEIGYEGLSTQPLEEELFKNL